MKANKLASKVATVLTVYGIETIRDAVSTAVSESVATALTVYGIETWPCAATNLRYD